MLCDEPWQVAEQRLYRGEAHLGVVCGLQYVLALDRGEQPGMDLLAAPVMAGARYGGQPVYFSDVVVRADSPARSLADLRGAAWAYNEPTSHSGYAMTRYTLASRGYGRVSSVASVVPAHTCGRWTGCSAAESTRPRSTAPCSSKSFARAPQLASQIRVIETFGPSPIPPLVVSRSLAADVRQALRSTLLQMHVDHIGRRVLSRARINRFVAVADADYDPIRRMWRVADDLEPWTDGAAYAEVAR